MNWAKVEERFGTAIAGTMITIGWMVLLAVIIGSYWFYWLLWVAVLNAIAPWLPAWIRQPSLASFIGGTLLAIGLMWMLIFGGSRGRHDS